jgi:hypothetical protein
VRGNLNNPLSKTQTNPSTIAVKSFFRGLPIAGLSAAGVIAVTNGNLWLVALTSFAINRLWASNVRAMREDVGRNYFAAGAMCGSVIAVWLLR